MESQQGNRPTVKQIRNHLVKSENMDSIGDTSIKMIFKKKLWYSFKRMSTIEHNSIKPINVRKFFESAILQVKLEENDYELIFIDEFSMSSKYHKHYGWSKIGDKGYLLTHYDSFNMFFVIAFSQRRIYGIKGYSKAMNLELITKFIDQVIEERKINNTTQITGSELFETAQASTQALL